MPIPLSVIRRHTFCRVGGEGGRGKFYLESIEMERGQAATKGWNFRLEFDSLRGCLISLEWASNLQAPVLQSYLTTAECCTKRLKYTKQINSFNPSYAVIIIHSFTSNNFFFSHLFLLRWIRSVRQKCYQPSSAGEGRLNRRIRDKSNTLPKVLVISFLDELKSYWRWN